jgi:hypothetical protein
MENFNGLATGAKPAEDEGEGSTEEADAEEGVKNDEQGDDDDQKQQFQAMDEPQEDDDDFGEFQDGNYCMLGSDDGLSNGSDSEDDHANKEPQPDKSTEPEQTHSEIETTTPVTQTEEPQDTFKSEDFVLTDEKVNKIKTAMSKLNLTPPPWAKAIPEEQWLNKILKRST